LVLTIGKIYDKYRLDYLTWHGTFHDDKYRTSMNPMKELPKNMDVVLVLLTGGLY
jgi:hypothetical protein